GGGGPRGRRRVRRRLTQRTKPVDPGPHYSWAAGSKGVHAPADEPVYEGRLVGCLCIAAESCRLYRLYALPRQRRRGRADHLSGAERRQRLAPSPRTDDSDAPLAVWRADPIERSDVRRPHAAPLEGIVDLERGHQAFLQVGLASDVGTGLDPERRSVTKALEDFLQGLDALAREFRLPPAARVQALEIAHGVRADRAMTVAGALEPRMSEDHRMAVAREANLHGDGIGAVANGRLECGDGVPGGISRRSTARDHQGRGRFSLRCLRRDLRGTLSAWARPS